MPLKKLEGQRTCVSAHPTRPQNLRIMANIRGYIRGHPDFLVINRFHAWIFEAFQWGCQKITNFKQIKSEFLFTIRAIERFHGWHNLFVVSSRKYHARLDSTHTWFLLHEVTCGKKKIAEHPDGGKKIRTVLKNDDFWEWRTWGKKQCECWLFKQWSH